MGCGVEATVRISGPVAEVSRAIPIAERIVVLVRRHEARIRLAGPRRLRLRLYRQQWRRKIRAHALEALQGGPVFGPDRAARIDWRQGQQDLRHCVHATRGSLAPRI